MCAWQQVPVSLAAAAPCRELPRDTITMQAAGFIPAVRAKRPYMTSYLTSMDTISLSRTVLEIMPVKILKAEQNGGF